MAVRLLPAALLLERAPERVVGVVVHRRELQHRPELGLGLLVPAQAEVGDAERLAGLAGPPFQLADAFQQAIDGGALVRAVEIGPTLDLTFPLDLVEQNFPYLRSL